MGYARPANAYGHLGISRRTFFRWRGYGEEAKDFPPFDDPLLLESWYERMRLVGKFKHQFPADIREAISKHLPASADAEPGPKPAEPSKPSRPAPTLGLVAFTSSPPPPGKPVPSSFRGAIDHGEEQGLMYEVTQVEIRVASLRKARDAEYDKGNRSEGDMLDKQHREALDTLSLIQQRVMKMAEAEGKLISREDVEADLAVRIPGVVVGGMFLFAKLLPLLEAAQDPAEKISIWRKGWQEHVQPLLQCKFLPEGLTQAPEQVWKEAADWIQSRVPPPLTLNAA